MFYVPEGKKIAGTFFSSAPLSMLFGSPSGYHRWMPPPREFAGTHFGEAAIDRWRKAERYSECYGQYGCIKIRCC